MSNGDKCLHDKKLIFKKDKEETLSREQDIPLKDTWKIMIIDDEIEVHHVTRLALKRIVFEDKNIEFISAYSAREAKELLQKQEDIAVILLDVVMEEEDAGLTLAHYIRNELNNKLVRIILRTGHPGQAPEEKVILDYDINDYREKTELTTQKLQSTMITALRSFRDLSIIDMSRRGLHKMIESSATIFEFQSLGKFASGVLTQLVALLRLQPSSLYCQTSAFTARRKGRDLDEFYILAATGNFESSVGCVLEECVSVRIWKDLQTAFQKKQSLYYSDRMVIYCSSKQGVENLIYFEGIHTLMEWEQNLIELFILNVSVAFDNLYLIGEVTDTQKDIILALGEVAEARSLETGHHVKRVAEVAKILGLHYGFSQDEAEILRIAASIHDLGKLAVADSILNKPGKLTTEEFTVMQQHAQLGYEMLKNSDRYILQMAACIALEHHEHYDGTGYPHGLKEEEIHIYSRIVALSDVFDALGNRRIYKKPWPLSEIIEYIRDQRSKQFDPILVDIFLENLEQIMKVREMFPDNEKS